MKSPRHSKLLTYLRDSGALASGDEERIRAAKAEYRRMYMRGYKQRYRATHGETRITFDREERTVIDRASREHGMKRPAFLKHATLAYLYRTYLVPDRRTVTKAEQGIAAIASELRTLARTQTSGLLDRAINYRKLSERVDRLEEIIHDLLRHPQEVEELLRRTGIDDPRLLSGFGRYFDGDT